MKRLTVFLAALASLFVGCKTDIATATQKAGVRSIKVERRVDVESPLRGGFDRGGGDITVMTADVIVNNMRAKKISRFAEVMHENGIDVPEMVHAQVGELLRSAKGFSVVTNNADAVLVVAIMQYGFEEADFSSKNVPFIVLRAELSSGGNRIWKGEGQIHPWLSKGLGANREDYWAQPDLLRGHWKIQIGRAARHLLHAKEKE